MTVNFSHAHWIIFIANKSTSRGDVIAREWYKKYLNCCKFYKYSDKLYLNHQQSFTEGRF